MSSLPFRIGHGYDVHALGEGLELWLGGARGWSCGWAG